MAGSYKSTSILDEQSVKNLVWRHVRRGRHGDNVQDEERDVAQSWSGLITCNQLSVNFSGLKHVAQVRDAKQEDLRSPLSQVVVDEPQHVLCAFTCRRNRSDNQRNGLGLI